MMNSYIEYNTLLFTDVWEDATSFVTDYQNMGIPTTITNDSANLLYYLLYARYGNTPIANMDTYQFKNKIFSIVFQYGPTWEKKLDIQKSIRNLTLADLQEGATAIYNRALNPETEPTTHTTTELNYINEQNVQKHKKNASQAYAEWMALLEEDVTGYFINKFKTCFKLVVVPERTLIYETEEEE